MNDFGFKYLFFFDVREEKITIESEKKKKHFKKDTRKNCECIICMWLNYDNQIQKKNNELQLNIDIGNEYTFELKSELKVD